MFGLIFSLNVFGLVGFSTALRGFDLILTSDPETPRAQLVNAKGVRFLGFSSQRFTFCIRVNLPKENNMRAVSIVSYSSKASGIDNEILLQINFEEGQTLLFINDNFEFASTNKVPSLDKWCHICASWECSTGKTHFYFDGEPSGEGETGKGKTIGHDGLLVLGQDQDARGSGYDPGEGVTGKLTQFHFWERVLTPDEVKKAEKCQLIGDLIDWDNTVWGLSGYIQVAESTAPCGQITETGNKDQK